MGRSDSSVDTVAALSQSVSIESENGDLSLVRRVQRGDKSAYDALVLKYQHKVLKLVRRYIRDQSEAEDVVQDAFIKAFQSINRFQGQSSFFTWLYRIAVNSTLTHLRKNRLRTFFSLEKVDENDRQSAEVIEALTDNSGVERDTYVKELQERLNEAMQKLSIKHRTVVTLFEIDGLGHQEIAEIMNCSVGTVRSRLHYAKQQLQSELQPYIRK